MGNGFSKGGVLGHVIPEAPEAPEAPAPPVAQAPSPASISPDDLDAPVDKKLPENQ